VSLRDSFAPDLATVFMNTGEMATVREFRISDGRGGFILFNASVVWDQEASKEMPMVKLHGVYMGDVRCHIEAKYLPRIPIAGELLYSPAHVMWEVLDVTDEESCYVLSLSATRSQPGKYDGNN
jgi:hypothetical protein